MNPNIIRFQQVDDILYRGDKPNMNQLYALKKRGVQTVIDFSTGYGSNPDERTEKENARLLDIN